ncbi:MAG: symmetrical bis(5'-nucleosyl)-tetraphosphatase [Acidobacteriota bacterium]
MGKQQGKKKAKPTRQTWVIGDVHGWKPVLDRLLDRMAGEGFDVDRDHLWMVGDLVHRGPDSLGVLRWAKAMDERMSKRFVAVLGNHDLHLLATATGRRKQSADLMSILDADDADALLAWLRRRPLAHRATVAGQDVLLIHAGLWPEWNAGDAIDWARRAEAALRGPQGDALLPGRGPVDEEPADPDLVRAMEAFTLLRTLDARSAPCRDKGPPDQAPPGCWPWFDASPRRWRDHRVLFGHWAALGRHRGTTSDGRGVEGLDSGCAWGGALTALRLDDGVEIAEPNPDAERPG